MTHPRGRISQLAMTSRTPEAKPKSMQHSVQVGNSELEVRSALGAKLELASRWALADSWGRVGFLELAAVKEPEVRLELLANRDTVVP